MPRVTTGNTMLRASSLARVAQRSCGLSAGFDPTVKYSLQNSEPEE
jgi:hypothetical protein